MPVSETPGDETRLQIGWALAAGAAALIAFGLPWLAGPIEARVGTRWLAALMALPAIGALMLPGMSGIGGRLAPSPAVRALLLLPFAAAVATGDPRCLRVLPAAIHGFVAWVFARSLWEETSLIEQAARLIEPLAPDFIRPWCRGTTGVWACAEALHAGVIATLAVWASASTWAAWAGSVVWILTVALAVGEYAARKAWFRYYSAESWLDRAWARLLPADRTAAGRRSLDYSRRMRSLGLRPRTWSELARNVPRAMGEEPPRSSG